jgi:hypothetical protein
MFKGKSLFKKEIAYRESEFSRHLENLSLNLSPKRRETLNFPPSYVGGLGGKVFGGLFHIT